MRVVVRNPPREAQNQGPRGAPGRWASTHQGQHSSPPCIATNQVLRIKIRCTVVAWLGCGIREGTRSPMEWGGGGGGREKKIRG